MVIERKKKKKKKKKEKKERVIKRKIKNKTWFSSPMNVWSM